MIPHPGESVRLDDANVTAGTPDLGVNGEAIKYRAGTGTLAAGDAFVAGFYEYTYLEAGADVVFSAVVVCEAGSSGVLRLSGGPDSTFNLNDGPASTYPLGDHVVSGAGEVVVTLPWCDVATYLDQDEATAVRVECLSGSVVVQQVKLRIWPPAGPTGGWSPQPGWTDTGAESLSRGGSPSPDNLSASSGSQLNADAFPVLRDSALPAARATYEAVPHTFPLGRTLALTSQAGGSLDLEPDGLDRQAASLLSIATLVVYYGGDPLARNPIPSTLVNGADYIRPPDEVMGDLPNLVQRATDPTWTWTGTPIRAIEAEMTPGSSEPSAGAAGLTVETWAGAVPAGARTLSSVVNYDHAVTHGLPDLTVTAVGVTTGTVTLPTDGDAIFALLTFSGAFDPPTPTGDAVYRLAIDPTPIPGAVLHPPYLVWNPTASTVEPLRLRQRGDGLAQGSVRVRGVGSRQMSVRVRGYL